jgi:hypothetical protein
LGRELEKVEKSEKQ